MILDSTLINELVRGDPDAVVKLDGLIDAGTPVALSALTVFEVGVGLRGEAARHGERFDGVVDDLDVAPLGVAEARRAVSIQHELLDRGVRIGVVDARIAATARERGEGVVTRNVSEFERVDGLDVETY
jgi:predicted nucleic acid-binding protein